MYLPLSFFVQKLKVLPLALLWGLLLLCSVNGFAQDRKENFKRDSLEFVDDMDDFLGQVDNKKAKEIMKRFEKIWLGGYFSEPERKMVYDICDRMIEKRMLPFPEFETYLEFVMVLAVAPNKKQVYNQVYRGVDILLSDKKKRPFFEFLEFCTLLLQDNTLKKSATTTWAVNNKNYTLTFTDHAEVAFEQVDLKCYAKGDSLIIYKTSGTYFPADDLWKGQGGFTYFTRAGFSKDQVQAQLSDYTIETKLSNYVAENVKFKNSIYFGDAELIGRLEDRLLANQVEETTSYPRFSSYDKRLRIANLIDKVDFEGGFSLNGLKFVGTGTGELKATITINREGKPFLVASSQSFIIRTDKISSQDAAITIYLDGDSIYHPGLIFRLNTFERTLNLLRGDEGNKRSPYFNSYHEIDMYFEQLDWIIDDPVMRFQPLYGSSNKVALFESNLFYQQRRYEQIKGIDDTHPLVHLKRAVDKFGKMVLTDKEIAQVWGVAPTQVRPELMRLSYLGFLSYDYDKNEVTVKQKTLAYVAARVKKIDYDVVQFNSNPQEDKLNAKLNLLNNELTLYGVKAVNLSDTHNVFVFPYNQEILLRKNRDFTFDGVVTAGRFEYFGYNFDFSYEKFFIDMPKIDSLRMYVETAKKDDNGQRVFRKVNTSIENLKGNLQIDLPNNRASLKPIKRFPIFTSEKESFAYYDRKTVQGGVYSRDSFYFELRPFVFDSLNKFTNERLSFEGTFYSSGIFPVFDEELKLQPDYSMGFVRPTPPQGYPVYAGKGKYMNDINLSNKGLKGDGTLEYITATAISKDFTFFPDSTNALCETFVIEEQMGAVEYPPVTGNGVYMHWEPYQDFMEVETRENPFIFYDGDSKFTGKIKYSPQQLSGGGVFAFKQAELESKLFDFKFYEFFSDTSDFRLVNSAMNEDENPLNIATSNLKAHVDFKERKAMFVSNDGSSLINFYDNQYIANMDRFTWFMDRDELELSGGTAEKAAGGAGSLDLEGSKFTSTNPYQDSLSFYSPAALYDIKRKIIYAKDVKYIEVADAEIVPDSGRVTIERRAKMRTLNNAFITANKITRYHSIYNATVDILARREYKAKGSYDYTDQNGKVQVVNLPVVGVDSTYQTYAIGKTTEEENFTLSPSFKFKGDINLQAAKRGLVFEGHSYLVHTCEKFPKSWFAFKAEINPEDIYIPVDSIVKAENGDKLYTGGLVAYDPVTVYSTFLNPVSASTDLAVVNAKGVLNFDKTNSVYQISNFEKLNQPKLPGNYIGMNTNSCDVFGEGKMSFGVDLGRVSYRLVGDYRHTSASDSIRMNGALLIDFFFDDRALKVMSDQVALLTDAEGLDFQAERFQKSLQTLVGKQEADRLISNITLYQNFRRFPESLEKTLFISDVSFVWDPSSESFVSVGKIGVGNIQKKQINKKLDGKIEIVKKRSGDVLNIYLKLDNKTYYYFQYTREVMTAYSTNEEFNTAIVEVKTGKNKLKRENKDQARYQFNIGSAVRAKQFANRFPNEL